MNGQRNWQHDCDANNIHWLSLDVAGSSVNTISQAVLEELETCLNSIDTASAAGIVISSAKPDSFIAGADINVFPTLTDTNETIELIRRGHAVLDQLENTPCPTLAYLNGATLGGGLELALACDYRLMKSGPDRCLGLPEVQLGLHPGLGGTVRAVQIAGVRQAMDLMLTGRSLSPKEALKAGFIDELFNPDEHWKGAAKTLLLSGRQRRSAGLVDRLLNIAAARPLLGSVLRKQVAKKARPHQYPAPYAILKLWQTYGASAEHGYQAEAGSFAELLQTPTAKNLIRVFFLQDNLKREPVTDVAQATSAHVIGAGVMGGDIAAWCVLRGMSVTLQDRELKYITPALDRARTLFEKRLRDPALVDDALARMQADVEGNGVAEADVIIEAIYENLEAKQALFRSVEQTAKPDAVLASNTSSIPLEDIASGLDNPSRLVGIHFFNPVAKMPLIEVIYSEGTATESVNSAIAFSRQIGKLPLRCKSSPGFLVNRVLGPYLDEAMRLSEEGVAPESIDKAAKDFGMPMGPVELSDSVGLDIALHVAEGLADITGRPVPAKLKEMVDKQLLGRKSGEGFYRYENGKAQRKKVSVSASEQEQITNRLVLALLNECAKCLDEGVIATADEADAGVIFGTGFAPFLGGPLNYAKTLGADAVINQLKALEVKHGKRFTPSPGWQKLR